MVDKVDSTPQIKDAPAKAGPPSEAPPPPGITAADNKILAAGKPQDHPSLSPLELHGHITPAVAEAFRADPVKAMLDIYSKGLTLPNETKEQTATRLVREAACKTRLEGLQKDDPKLFADITRIGEQIASNQLSPAQAGREVGEAAAAVLQRARVANKGQSPEFTDAVGTGMVALSSTMLAERGTFGDSRDVQKTREMIDAADAVLRKNGAGDMALRGPNNALLPAKLYGVTWKDNGEPALCGWTTDGKKDRYKFEIVL